MIKKGLAVAVILLFIGVAFAIPINAKDIEIKDDKIEPLDVGRWIIRGSGLFPIFWGDNVTFFARHLHIIIITGTQRDVVTISKRWITLPKDIVPLYIFPLYRLIYIFLLYVGGFEPPDNIMMLNNEMRILS